MPLYYKQIRSHQVGKPVQAIRNYQRGITIRKVRASGHDITFTETEAEAETETITYTDVAEDSFVYVHCHLENYSRDALIRIWKTTFLIDHSSGHRSELLHAENITFAPLWTRVPGVSYSFLLIFSGLPKSCLRFDLIEEIPQPGGFIVKNIARNQTDVYHVSL